MHHQQANAMLRFNSGCLACSSSSSSSNRNNKNENGGSKNHRKTHDVNGCARRRGLSFSDKNNESRRMNDGDNSMRRRQARSALIKTQSSSSSSSSESITESFEAMLDPVYKNVFYDVPVSNNGARNRLIMYWKQIDKEFEFKNPSAIGGLKSEEYLKMHPQGKMPLLVTKDGRAIPESEVISQYLLDAYEDKKPSLRCETVEQKTACNLLTRWHDIYMVPIQGCMYRGPMAADVRAAQISDIDRYLDIMEKTTQEFEGPYLCGAEPCTADAALFPTFVFMTHLLPKYFGWENVFDGRPSLERWYKFMVTEDESAKKVKMEVMGGLIAWDESDRYEKNGLIANVANDSFQWSY